MQITDTKKQIDKLENIKNAILTAAEDSKANNIKLIDVKHLTQLMDYMIIASGTSNRHIQTIAENSIKAAQELGYDKPTVEGLGKSEWVVVDFVDIVLHVMSPEAREHYNIEGLWDIAPKQEKQ